MDRGVLHGVGMEHGVKQAHTRVLPGATRGRMHVIVRVLGWLLLGYAIVWSYHFASVFLGPFGPLAFLLFIGLVMLAATPWLLARYRGRLRATGAQVADLLWRPVRASRVPARVARHAPRLSRFVAARFALDAATGLSLTVVLAVAAAIAWTFGLLLLEVVTGSSLLATDRRVINLAATLRTPVLDRGMLLITFLGNGSVAALVAGAAVLVGLLARRRDALVFVPLSLLVSWLFFSAVKALVVRPRPLLETARIVAGGWSFPSGHASVSAALYGTLVFLLLRSTRSTGLRSLVLVVGALVVLAIGGSRVYLGVHYPSDVVAGWTAGALWLAALLAVERVRRPRLLLPLSPARRNVTVALLAALLLLGGPYLFLLLRNAPAPSSVASAPVPVAAADLAQVLGDRMERPSETLLGEARDPLSVVFVGSQPELERAFAAAGWTAVRNAALGTVRNPLTTGRDGLDPVAPVSPLFVTDQPNAFAFVQPVGNDAPATRLVVRVWSTPFEVPPGQRVWLAGTGLERSIELAPITLLPERPVVATTTDERDSVVRGLEATGTVARRESLQLTGVTDQAAESGIQPLVVWLRAASAAQARRSIAGLQGNAP